MLSPTWTLTSPSQRIPAEGASRRLRMLAEEIASRWMTVSASGAFIQAEQVRHLEALLSAQWGVKQAVAVNAGTSALRMAYDYVQRVIWRDDPDRSEIITTPLTYIATAYAASDAGYLVQFADIDPDTYTLDPDAVRALITPHTAAIVPVHLYGQPADMPALLQISRETGIPIIEDAAQAIGASYTLDGQQVFVGSQALGALSFYPGKNAGGIEDGGALLSPYEDPESSAFFRGVRDQGRGQGQRYLHDQFGWKLRMGELNAAAISLQIEHYLPTWTRRRRAIAAHYSRELARYHGDLLTPGTARGRDPVYYKYAVLCRTASLREALEAFLQQHQVETERIYPHLVPDQPLYRTGQFISRSAELLTARGVVDRLLCLPMHECLTDGEVSQVCDLVQRFFRDGGRKTLDVGIPGNLCSDSQRRTSTR